MFDLNNTRKRMSNLSVCNFDSSIDAGIADILRVGEGDTFSKHYAHNFCGIVYYEDGSFHEDIIIFGVMRETMSDESISGLVKKVNDKYGLN